MKDYKIKFHKVFNEEKKALNKISLPRSYRITLLYLCGFTNDISKCICHHIMYTCSLPIVMLLLEVVIQICIVHMFKLTVWTRVKFQIECSWSNSFPFLTFVSLFLFTIITRKSNTKEVAVLPFTSSFSFSPFTHLWMSHLTGFFLTNALLKIYCT